MWRIRWWGSARSSRFPQIERTQAALELNVKLDLLVGDAAEYKFEPTRFDLIVLFYHLDRSRFPQDSFPR